MPPSPLTRRKALQLTAGLGMPALGGCIVDVDHVLNYEPGAISVLNNDDQRHSVSVTLYLWDRSVWVENQKPPVEHNPEIPDAEPEVQRDFTFEVPRARRSSNDGSSTIRCAVFSSSRVGWQARCRQADGCSSRCTEDEPRSNLDIELVIDNDGKLHVNQRTGQDD